MSNRVYTYSKITELKNAPYFAEIAALPQIIMSQEMAVNMVYDMRIFKGNTMGFSMFAMRMFPGWNTSSQKFAYLTVLNQFMREKISNARDKAERDWLFGCKKNIYAAINNILRLECLLHNKNTKSCKTKMEKVASPFWRMLQLHQNRLLEPALVRLQH